jgi:hypothetical protein
MLSSNVRDGVQRVAFGAIFVALFAGAVYVSSLGGRTAGASVDPQRTPAYATPAQ